MIYRDFFFFMLLFWTLGVPVYLSVLNNTKYQDTGSLVLLLKLTLLGTNLINSASCSECYWFELFLFFLQTVLSCWKTGWYAKVLLGFYPAGLLAFKSVTFRSQKRKHKRKRLPMSFYTVRSRINSSFHWYSDRSSYTSHNTIRASPRTECVLSCIVPFT